MTDSNRYGYVVLAAAGAYVVASMPVMERIWYRDRIREYGGVRGFGAILRSQR